MPLVFFCNPKNIQKPEVFGTYLNEERPETIWNHPKTTWNQVLKLFSILYPKVVFEQIWSQKLKFSKLTKIWYRGTLLHPHVEFNPF